MLTPPGALYGRQPLPKDTMTRRRRTPLTLPILASCALMLLAGPPGGARAGEVVVAVAANFLNTAERLAGRFGHDTGHQVTLVSGSTGALYAQIAQGAPYGVLLAADQSRPARLIADGLAVPGSRFTYALGRISVWSADPQVLADGIGPLKTGAFRHIAIANPELAPYGVAARQALAALGLEDAVSGRLVLGQNIGQTMAMVATGNAGIGIVATSLLNDAERGGSRWDIPEHAHDPIRQDAVLLHSARDPATATAFLVFLQSDTARAMIDAAGYTAPR